MVGTVYSIIPALVMLVLVLLTRKVLLSLGTGIVIGALFIHEFHVIDTLKEIVQVFVAIFYSSEGIEIGNILLLLFLVLLGIMIAFLQASGGSRAFGEWMIKRVRTRTGSQLMTVLLGFIIFIDDYFSSLAVGQISRPLTDRHNVSRAKLAYLIDSTSSPVTVLSPISSWGAYIIGILGGLFAAKEITDFKPLEAFIKTIPYNLYAIIALILVFIVIYANFLIGPMKRHEERALKKGQLLGQDRLPPGDLSNTFTPNQNGKAYHLFIPIIVLLVTTIVMMYITGWMASDGETNILAVFANTDVNISLFIGGTLSVLIALILYLKLPLREAKLVKIVKEGTLTMVPAITILLLAWMIGSIIGTLQTGEYLAGLVTEAQMKTAFLPFLFFLIASIMSLSTGTSWGTFGIMLPIAVDVLVITDMNLLLPTLGAVLAGAVFGDHCTPISDTTILSSTGAGVHHIDHVVTQLPYAFIAAISAGLGYLFIGFTNQVGFGLMISIIILAIIVVSYQLVHLRKV